MATARPQCKYGNKCYRQNQAHLTEFFHPKGDRKLESSDIELDTCTRKRVREPTSPSVHIGGNIGGLLVNHSKSPEFELCYSPEHSLSPSTRLATRYDSSVTDTEPDVSIVQKPLNNDALLKLSSPYQDAKSHTFMFTTVGGISAEFNEYPRAVSLKHLFSESFGDLDALILFSYLVDVDWVLEQLTESKQKIPILIVAQLETELLKTLKKQFSAFPNLKFLFPKLPIPFGTHHTKMLLLFYPNGMRVVITTANFIPVDWGKKTQGVWISPFFPLRDSKVDSVTDFQQDLIDYLKAYQVKTFDFAIEKVVKHEMSDVTVRLIASVPGYHKGQQMYKWGHLKMRKVLGQIKSKSMIHDWPLIAQFSSIGSLGKTANVWLESEWKQSFTLSPESTPLSMVYPTVENVRTSLEGYSAGKSIPYSSKTCKNQLYLNRYFHQWKNERNGRSHAAPHIKTYLRCSPDCSSLAWLLLTSANLSKAAWGSLQKDSSQLMIRSYELGVLFLPQEQHPPRDTYPVTESADDISLYYERRNSVLIPIDLPLIEYQVNDEPWIVDFSYSKPDIHGRSYPHKP